MTKLREIYKCNICGNTTSNFDIPIHNIKFHLCSYKCKNIKQKINFKNSSNRMTKNNCGYHNKFYHSDEDRLKYYKEKSISMKEKIAKGEFTPCITNSWARSRCYIDDIPFRSSWEAMFYLINPLPFEKIRVPYIGLDNTKHSYIIDFHDNENRILYEIKPSNNIDNELVQIKEKAAIEYLEYDKRFIPYGITQ